MSDKHPEYEWVFDPDKNRCPDCERLNRHGAIPKSEIARIFEAAAELRKARNKRLPLWKRIMYRIKGVR